MKKGIIFTLISIVLVALLLSGVITYYSFTRNEKAQLLSLTVSAMDQMLDDTQADMSRAAYISSFRALLSMGEVISNMTLSDVQAPFSSLFMNGSYLGTQYALMQNNTFPNWTAKAIANAENLDFTMEFSVHSININQSSPWNVDIFVNISASLRDTKNIAQINKTFIVMTSVSIEEFEDPLYTIYTNNTLSTSIVPSPYERNFSSDLVNLQAQIGDAYYVATPMGPSFLMRFTGSLGPSPYGIETLLDFQRFWDNEPQILPYENRSNVDFLYWNHSATYKNWTISGMPDWFRLDALNLSADMNRTRYYGVENLTQPN